MKAKVLANEKWQIFALLLLTSRNMKLYFKDKAAVFFSFLSPLIIIMLYVLFLGRVQIEGIESSIPEGVVIDGKLIRQFIDGWMLAGVMAVTCITVALNAMNVMVADKERKCLCDFTASPVSAGVVMFSYFLAALAVTLIISTAVLAAGLIYLAATNGFSFGAGDVFELLGVVILSSLSATFVVMLVIGFIKTQSALGAFMGIVSALIGFIIGAYMPISTFPTAIQYVADIVPGTYSAGIFRNIFMAGALEQMPAEFAQALSEAYSLNISFFGADIGKNWMYVILAASVPLFMALCLLRSRRKGKNKE